MEIRQRLPGLVRPVAPARAGAAGFPGRRYRPNPPCPSLALSGNRTDQSATGRLLRRSVGSRFSRAVRAIRGDCSHASAATLCALLFLAGFDSHQIRQRLPARSGAAKFPTGSIAPTALALRLRSREIGPIDLPLADCSDGPLVPGFRGRCGRSGAASSQSPIRNSLNDIIFLRASR